MTDSQGTGSRVLGAASDRAAVAPHEGAVSDRLTITVPRGAVVLACSDLHLGASATDASALVAGDLADRLAAINTIGVIVLNGDCFELLAGRRYSVDAVLDAHPAFEAALAAARARGAELIVTIGNHDGRLAWDATAAAVITDRLGALLCFVVDLVFDTARGARVVRAEHGHRFDAANAFDDPRNPLDTPLGHHVVQEILPSLEAQPMLRDVESLLDPNEFSRFLGSRIVYRQLLRRWWVVLLPAAVALVVRVPVVVRALSDHRSVGHVERWLLVGSIGLAADLVLLVVLGGLVIRRVFRGLAGTDLGPRGSHLNAPPHTAAEALCAEGFAGFLTGHTHAPELTPVAGGFYANTGCGTPAIDGHPARLGLPPVYFGVNRRSWIELEGGRDLEVRLWLADTPLHDLTTIERFALRQQPAPPTVPTVIADLPTGAAWPVRNPALADTAHRTRARRLSAIGSIVVAAVGLASSLTPPLRGRLRWLIHLMPVEIPQAASTSLVFASLALVLCARGLRRGLWTAWVATCGLLAASAVLNLTKGVDLEEAIVALAVLLWLVATRRHFRVRPDAARTRRALLISVIGTGTAVLVSGVLVVIVGAHRAVDLDESLLAMVERLAGKQTLPLPSSSPFIGPALTATGIGLVVVLLWLAFSPARRPKVTPAEHRADRERARSVVAAHGGDTLAFFALRDDRSWYFTDRSVVAYAVRNGVCLVSPDPIGPAEERAETWVGFAAFADARGWSIAVVGAQPAWVPIYESTGMRALYMGDEAIVDCQSFTLDGGPMKSVRGAYNRVVKAGYSVEFVDPSRLGDTAKGELRDIMTQTRQGDTERGFSMTLSRLFDPDDVGLLLAVARNRDGRADAFCQFVPAADIDGWSLDLMRRRADADLPNGLTDFVVIETIKHVHEQRRWGLCLNFAVMRAVMAGEREGAFYGLERRVLKKFSDTMQIESLWRYNEKFRPYWRPRYVVLGGAEHAAAQGVAIADAEAIWELPVIGRFLGRHD